MWYLPVLAKNVCVMHLPKSDLVTRSCVHSCAPQIPGPVVDFNFFDDVSFAGVSGKSQIMFAIVFTTRYLDLFTNFISLYNTCMKVFFIASSVITVYLMYFKFRATYDSNHDTFRMEFLIVPVGGLAFLVNHDFSPLEVNSHLKMLGS